MDGDGPRRLRGWYVQAKSSCVVRYWDGQGWTDFLRNDERLARLARVADWSDAEAATDRERRLI